MFYGDHSLSDQTNAACRLFATRLAREFPECEVMQWQASELQGDYIDFNILIRGEHGDASGKQTIAANILAEYLDQTVSITGNSLQSGYRNLVRQTK